MKHEDDVLLQLFRLVPVGLSLGLNSSGREMVRRNPVSANVVWLLVVRLHSKSLKIMEEIIRLSPLTSALIWTAHLVVIVMVTSLSSGLCWCFWQGSDGPATWNIWAREQQQWTSSQSAVGSLVRQSVSPSQDRHGVTMFWVPVIVTSWRDAKFVLFDLRPLRERWAAAVNHWLIQPPSKSKQS